MNVYREMDYLADLDAGQAALASNPAWSRSRGSGKAARSVLRMTLLCPPPGVVRILMDQISLTRSFYLIRHSDDQHNAGLSLFSELIASGLSAEVATLEAQA